MTDTAPTTIRWSKVAAAHAEGAEYVGEYRGLKVRVTRLTDFNDDGAYYGKAATVTRWDGWVEELDSTGRPFWGLTAECYATRRDATAALVRSLDRRF